jgi:hypothetical protein
MKHFGLILLILISLAACKKDAGKHCPLIIDDLNKSPFDLSSVKGFPSIIDTLTKYPQLKVVRADVTRAINDTTHYTANILCHVYSKDLVIFDYYYFLLLNNYGWPGYSSAAKIPTDISISATPAISLEKANQIAKDAIHFEHCTVSGLGFKNYSTDSVANYKLIWRIKAVENNYPKVEIDAQSGEILTLIKNHIIID